MSRTTPPTIVKVQTDHRGSDTVMVYAEGRRLPRLQHDPKLAKQMGVLCKRYYRANFNKAAGIWDIGARAETQDW